MARLNAVALQIPGHEQDEFVIARDQSEYIPLPAIEVNVADQIGVLTRWRPTEEERAALANGADIWLITLTGGEPLQPIRMEVECPINQKPT